MLVKNVGNIKTGPCANRDYLIFLPLPSNLDGGCKGIRQFDNLSQIKNVF